jgi:hypothetical protein
MKLVSVFMDVEDPINPRSDDAALDIALIFSASGVRGSFCITGEKCRTLLQCGRQDVIDAFKPHCLGLHTDTHSFHPTTMELLAKPDWEEGCELAFQTQSRGETAFHQAFDRSPAFWGGAGNTWSAEITDALKKLNIPAYGYALTRLPGDPVHRFNGVMAFPQNLSISEPEWRDDVEARFASNRVLSKVEESNLPWVGIFAGHPTKLRHKDYWDTPYFGGRTPPEPEFVEPVPVEEYEAGKKNLGAFLKRLSVEAKVVGLDEVIAKSWTFRRPTNDEIHYFERETASAIRSAAQWPVHWPGLDPENMVLKALALKDSVEVGYLPAP